MKRLHFVMSGFLATLLMIGVLSVAIWALCPSSVYANTDCDKHCWYSAVTNACQYSTKDASPGLCDTGLSGCPSTDKCCYSNQDCVCR